MKKQEKRSHQHQHASSNLSRRRQLISGPGAAYRIYKPSLNLSENEYEKKLEEIKKMGNFG